MRKKTAKEMVVGVKRKDESEREERGKVKGIEK